MPGIATGSILALSRAIGEAAPLILIGATTFVTFNPEGLFSRYVQRPGADGERSARFNLHVAATRARRAVTIMTPEIQPCHILP